MPPPETDAAEARRRRLLAAAAELDVAVDATAADRLLAYVDLLQRWNATYNLTAVRDPDRMLTQHVVDCLAVIEPLRRHIGLGSAARVLDVGSGGGLPGVVVAALCPTIEVTCVDTVGKKAAFIQQAAASLKLQNLRARHCRVEQLDAGVFNVVTSRAFASLADFVALTRRQLADGGAWLAMKGKDPADERDALPADIDVFHVEPLRVPGMDAERCLVWMRPKPSL